MSDNKILTRYVSEIDQFLQEFDQKNPKLSLSQQKEIAKHQRVQTLRDKVTEATPDKKLWEDF